MLFVADVAYNHAAGLGRWGSLATSSRVVRGGAWNNNPDNARAAYRNHNTPDNWNDNQGFRLLCGPTSLPPLQRRRPASVFPNRPVASLSTATGTGSASGIGRRPRFAARGEGLKMAQVSPVRTEGLSGQSVGRISKRGASWAQAPRRLTPLWHKRSASLTAPQGV